MPGHEFVELLKNMPHQPPPIDINPVLSDSQVEGRVIVITGANVGLGFEAARHFAALNPARLILACRNEEKGNKAVEELKHSTGFNAIELQILDTADYSSIVAFSDGIIKDIGRIDILVLNAGTSNNEFIATKDGVEAMLQTNTLGPALLTLLLLPTLRKTELETMNGPAPRIVNVSSSAYHWTSLDEELINHPTILKRLSEPDYCTPAIIERRYADSKLFSIWFLDSLQSILDTSKSRMIINSVDPGFVITNFQYNLPEDVRLAAQEPMKAKSYSTEEGSRFLVQGALESSNDILKEKKLKGVYFSYGKVQPLSEFSTSETGKRIQQKLWVETLEELSKVDRRIRSSVERL